MLCVLILAVLVQAGLTVRHTRLDIGSLAATKKASRKSRLNGRIMINKILENCGRNDAQQYSVPTGDGYTLTMFRIPTPGGHPVLLQHALCASGLVDGPAMAATPHHGRHSTATRLRHGGCMPSPRLSHPAATAHTTMRHCPGVGAP